MKKINYYITMCMILLLSTAISAQTTVLGYFPSYRATSVVRYDKLTDIAFAFINCNTDGSLITTAGDATFGFDYNKFITVRDAAATNNVKLWIALGGADASELRSARLSSVSNNSTYRAKLVSDLVSFAITHGCYGIDIDWEFPKDATARAGHLALVTALRAAINASSKPTLKISLAVGGEYKNEVNHLQYIDNGVISNGALVDKWNIMAYDFPTSYNANHSSYSDAQLCIEAWNAKGVPYSEMVLGVPFYARNSWGELMYSELTGTASVNYTADVANGYYYNGKTTLESKMDLIVGKGGLGILIWDLGQDRSAGNYSLLDAIDAKAATLCLVPKPNMGPDKGVCSGSSTTLDPGVATASGRNFAWYKNGVSTGQSTTTISVNSAGTYKVVITQGGCSKEDEIVIVSGSSVTTTGVSGCNNVSLTVSVNNPAGGKTYKWYDAASGGTQLGTGTTYSAIFPTTKTVYVEEGSAGVVTYNSSPTDATVTTPANNYWWLTQPAAQRLVASSDLTVKSLRVMAHTKGGVTFKVKVINSSTGVAVTEAGPFTQAANASAQDWEQTYFDVTTNFLLPAGSYFIYPEITSGKIAHLPNYNNESTQSGVYTLKKGMYRNYSSPAAYTFVEAEETDPASFVHYGPFLKWVIETGASASCGRTAATATVTACGPPTITISTPTATNYDRNAVMNFAASITDEGTVSTVVYEVFKGASLVQTLTVSNSGSNYTSTWTPTVVGTDYSFKVTATDNSGNSSTKTVLFTVSSPVGVGTLSKESVQLYPNPSESSFQLNVGSVSSFDVLVYSISGQLLESQRVSGNATSFGANLSSGLYVVKVVSNEGTFQTQVVKK